MNSNSNRIKKLTLWYPNAVSGSSFFQYFDTFYSNGIESLVFFLKFKLILV